MSYVFSIFQRFIYFPGFKYYTVRRRTKMAHSMSKSDRLAHRCNISIRFHDGQKLGGEKFLRAFIFHPHAGIINCISRVDCARIH